MFYRQPTVLDIPMMLGTDRRSEAVKMNLGLTLAVLTHVLGLGIKTLGKID